MNRSVQSPIPRAGFSSRGGLLILQGPREWLLSLADLARSVEPIVVLPLEEAAIEQIESLEFLRTPLELFDADGAPTLAGGVDRRCARIIGGPDLGGLADFLAFNVAPNSSAEIEERGWHTHLPLDQSSALEMIPDGWARANELMLSGPNP